MQYQRTFSDYVFDAVKAVILVLVIAVTLYPVIYVLSMSISNPRAALRGDVFLWPIGFSRRAYEVVFANPEMWTYYGNTLWYTVIGTICSVVATVLGGYPLSKERFFARKFFMVLITVTMFFGGGLIPTYLVVTKLGLYNNRWAMILPSLTSAWYIIVCRSFFQTLPEDLFESARLDGASEFRILLQFAVPLSKPILATLSLYYGVGYWNSFFPAVLYLGDSKLHPVQIYLRRVVIQSSPEAMQNFDMSTIGGGILAMMQVKYAVIVVTILPIIMLYPFLQKYFVKGMLIGSLKD